MPLYEYHCSNCNRTYEELQGANALKTIDCPECGTLAERVFSVPAKPASSRSSDTNSQNHSSSMIMITNYQPGCPACESYLDFAEKFTGHKIPRPRPRLRAGVPNPSNN